jgi:hypothetical protein
MLRLSIVCFALSVSLAGCKASDEPIPAESPAAPYAPEAPAQETDTQTPSTLGEAETFTTLDQAEAALARAEQELIALNSPPAATAGAPAAAPGAPPSQEGAPAPAPPPAPAPSRAEAEKKSEEKPSTCPSLCRAFASLARAADAVCRLSGEEGERCTRARGSVRTHFQRVAVCRCTL